MLNLTVNFFKRSHQEFIPARQGLAGGLRPDYIGTTKNGPHPDGGEFQSLLIVFIISPSFLCIFTIRGVLPGKE